MVERLVEEIVACSTRRPWLPPANSAALIMPSLVSALGSVSEQ